MTHSSSLRASRSRSRRRSFAASFVALFGGLAACGGDGGTGGGGGGAGGSGDGGSGGVVVIEKPNRFRMRLDDAAVPEVVLELDKDKALQLFGRDGASQIKVLDVDTTALLRNALEQIQGACGNGWSQDTPNPNPNCQLTELGRTFGADPAWRTSPQFALVRLLTMTPANANITRTSLEDFKALIDGNPGTFAFTFADVLAQSLGIRRTDPFVPIPRLIEALQIQLLGSHPAIKAGDPTGRLMPVTLYEALNDLRPLPEKLGPIGAAPWTGAGEHPGVLVADNETESDVLTDQFRMRVVAESALRRVSGVDLSKGAGDMFLRDGDAPLRFDFRDPEKLQISEEGINPAATVNMRIQMRELSGVMPSCTDVPGCKSNYPDTPVGTGTVWTLSPFLLEPIVARAALLAYGGLRFARCYLTFSGTCRTGVDIGQNSDPAGWAVFTADLSFGGSTIETPDPQFIWELLTEVAQTAVHDPTGDGAPDIGEGAAEPVFALKRVGIGLTRDEIIANLRETLQGQSKQIADIILGRYWINNDGLDFFYGRVEPGGDPYLFFVSEDDLRPDEQGSDTPRPYRYEKPGFFSSPDLSDESKLSKKEIPGVDSDITHEKLRLSTGVNKLYMRDDEGADYEVLVYVPDADDPVEITADVKRL